MSGFREEVAPYLAGSIIYHCGPVMRKNPDGSYDFVAARPRTSAREEPYQADVIARYGVRGVIGKGGMFDKTRKGLVEHRAVYLHAVGGTAQSLARRGPRRAHVQAGRIRRARGHVGDLSEGLPDGGHHGRARRVAARDHRRGLLGLKAG